MGRMSTSAPCERWLQDHGTGRRRECQPTRRDEEKTRVLIWINARGPGFACGATMPLYEYRCRDCGQCFEELVSSAAARENSPECPACRSTDTKRLLSAFSPRRPVRAPFRAAPLRRAGPAAAAASPEPHDPSAPVRGKPSSFHPTTPSPEASARGSRFFRGYATKQRGPAVMRGLYRCRIRGRNGMGMAAHYLGWFIFCCGACYLLGTIFIDVSVIFFHQFLTVFYVF